MLVKDIGIDLGIVNVLIYVKGKGIVLNELFVVVIDKNINRVLVVGEEVRCMVGRMFSNIIVICFLKDGVIVDFEIIEFMFKYFINKLNVKGFLFKFCILICCLINIIFVE